MRATSISISVQIGLRFVGIWPDLSHGTLTWLTYMTSVTIALYFQYVYILDHFNVSNISNLIDGLSITLAYSFGFLKLISLWLNRRYDLLVLREGRVTSKAVHLGVHRVFYNILLAMDEDWDNVGHDQFLLCTMSSNANLSRLCSNVLISLNSTAAICYAATSLVRHSTDLEGNFTVTVRELPIKMKFPFETDASPLFELLAIAQSLHEVSIAALVAMINSLIITLVSRVDHVDDVWAFKIFRDFGKSAFFRRVRKASREHNNSVIKLIVF